MKQDDTKKEIQRGKRGSGRLYKRDGSGKEYPADSKVHGAFWLQYKVNGQRVRQRLLDANGESIASRRAAEKARQEILEPFSTADDVEQLRRVQAKLTEAETLHAKAIEIANPPLSIGNAWEAYLHHKDALETGADTLKYYAGYWKKLSEWLKKKYPEAQYLRDITPEMADSYVSKLNRLKLTPNTFNKHIGFLKLLFKTLYKKARLTANPFEETKKRKLKTKSRRELTLAELTDLIASADGELKTLLMIGASSGLRLGDCATLKFNEVDFDRKQIRRIPNKLRHNDNAKPVKIGLPLDLLHRLAETPINKRKGFVLPEYAGLYNYRNTSGRPTKQPEITNRIQTHFAKCGIQTHADGTGKTPEYLAALKTWMAGDRKDTQPTYKRAIIEVGFHSLRHTYVSLQAERGVPQSTVQASVGHGNPSMTQHYLHVTDKAAADATLELNMGVLDADFEVLDDPLPQWACELIDGMAAKSWKQVKKELLDRGRKI